METTDELDSLDPLISLCKRRGFIFQSSEIYGGLNGFWDYGPLGVELRRRIHDHWWESVVRGREDVVGYDASIIMHPRVWEASGHVGSFYDVMVDCTECKRRYRLDHLGRELDEEAAERLDRWIESRRSAAPAADETGDESGSAGEPSVADRGGEVPVRCPHCGGEFTPPRQFGLMFETRVGAARDTQSIAYLRPETAQAIFTAFRNVELTARMKVPFGIAQTGKAFRNEVTPRNFTFRSREFEQMELEFFVHPDDEDEWFDYWLEERHRWYEELGVRPEKLRRRQHGPDELAHYAKSCTDVEYEFPFGWQELEGIANRGTFDLEAHTEHSGKDLSYYDPERQEKYVPAVIEASAGLDRTVLTVLCDAFAVEEVEGEERTVLRLAPHVAPRQVAVFPLHKKLDEPSRRLYEELKPRFEVLYDDGGSIGKRYRRQDEVGTPFCITFDFDSLEDGKATVRDRDTMEQERVSLDGMADYLEDRLAEGS